jgi:2-oxoglutarate dehydrogenase E1 component
MGGWTFVQDRLEALAERPKYVGRSASASPATGSYSIHQKEQTELVSEALNHG